MVTRANNEHIDRCPKGAKIEFDRGENSLLCKFIFTGAPTFIFGTLKHISKAV